MSKEKKVKSKVLIVTTLYPNDDERAESGVTQAIKVLVESAVKQGLSVVGVLRLNHPLKLLGKSFGHTVLNGIDIFDTPRFGIRQFFASSFSRFLFFRCYGKKVDFGIIVCHRATQLFFARKIFGTNPKYVFVVHQSDLKSPFLNYAVKHSSSILARSYALKKRLSNIYPSVCIDGVVSSGVDTIPRNPDTDDNINIDSGIVLAFAGNLIPLKNVDSIIRAVSIVHRQGIKVRFHVMGAGPMKKNLLSLVHELDLESLVRFHGHLRRTDVLSIMAESNIFVMPSAPETFGLAYLEAMSQGCVVIGHKDWGIDGLVTDDRNGYLVESAEPEIIAEKILRYINLSSENRAAIHRNSYRIALSNSVEQCAKNYKKQIEKVVS